MEKLLIRKARNILQPSIDIQSIVKIVMIVLAYTFIFAYLGLTEKHGLYIIFLIIYVTFLLFSYIIQIINHSIFSIMSSIFRNEIYIEQTYYMHSKYQKF